MNAQEIENQTIWKQIKGAEKLFEIYGFYPTFHDAAIQNIDVNYERREFSIIFDYCDFIQKPGDEILTKFTICWKNVQKANFNWYGEDLTGMKFSKEEDFIKTKFKDYSFGFDGQIISSEVEITNLEVSPEEDRGKQGHTIKLSVS